MNGYQVTFFTQQDRKHEGVPLAEWLLQQAKSLGIGGGTILMGVEGFGHSRHLHSHHFFELADQPVEVTLALSQDESQRFFDLLRAAKVKVFYVKMPVEYGVLGAD